MTVEILKGKPVADKNMQYCLDLIEKDGLKPRLVVFLIGNDPASGYYVESIKKQGAKNNIVVDVCNYSEGEIDEVSLIEKIRLLNEDSTVHGIMVQKPLPKHFDVGKIELTISPDKDVDGFHALNSGLMLQEKECFLPCTAEAILEIMDYYGISAEGKHCVVVGRSNVVGKPVANLLLYKAKNRNATVTVCHSRTVDLAYFTRLADILIVAVGISELIKADMVKEGVIILDAGINEALKPDGKVSYVGDVDFESCCTKCHSITPVPGGVGSVTTSILFKHLCDSARK